MLKSNFEKHLDEICRFHEATWTLTRGVLTIRRPGFKELQFKAWGHVSGVDLEGEKDFVEVRWTAKDKGLSVLNGLIRDMKQERWQLSDQHLALMALRDAYPETADWKEKLNLEIQGLLEVFPEFENEAGKLAPCPSYWMAVSDLGYSGVVLINLNGEIPQSLADICLTVRQEFEKTIPLGLPLSKPASQWVSRAQSHYLLKWLREDVTRLLFIWDGKVEPEVLSTAMSKLSKQEIAPLVEPIKALHKSDPAKLRKVLPGFGF